MLMQVICLTDKLHAKEKGLEIQTNYYLYKKQLNFTKQPPVCVKGIPYSTAGPQLPRSNSISAVNNEQLPKTS